MEEALLDTSGNPSPLYEPAKQANSEILNLGQTLRFLESTDIRFVQGQPSNPIPGGLTPWSIGAGGDTHIQNIQVVEQGEYKDGLIGFFTDDTGQEYFMLVNLYQDLNLNYSATALNFNVTFDSSVNTVWRLRRSDGVVESVAVPNNTLSLTLPGGTGDLFKYDNGDFQMSGCADVNYPYPSSDLDGDCYVNSNDFEVFLENWLQVCTTPDWCVSCDMNTNGSVDLVDFAILADNWLDCTDPFQPCNYTP